MFLHLTGGDRPLASRGLSYIGPDRFYDADGHGLYDPLVVTLEEVLFVPRYVTQVLLFSFARVPGVRRVVNSIAVSWAGIAIQVANWGVVWCADTLIHDIPFYTWRLWRSGTEKDKDGESEEETEESLPIPPPPPEDLETEIYDSDFVVPIPWEDLELP